MNSMDSNFHMIDVGEKAVTARVAEAQGRIHLSAAAFEALVQGKNPKGNVLALAEVAGLMSAKKTSDLLPLCHPLPIDQISLRFICEPSTKSVLVLCEVRVHAKTGVEMEALCGVNGALLCIYDLSKAVDPVLSISDIRLNTKTGGKSGVWNHPDLVAHAAKNQVQPLTSGHNFSGLRFAVMTVSDRSFAGQRADGSGPALRDSLEALGGQVVAMSLVPDEKEQIAAEFRRLAVETPAQIVISTGGTGMALRDVTPEALIETCERIVPGFGEALRADGARHKKTAWLSRSTAGSWQGRLWVALPGSPKAVVEGVAVLKPFLKHALQTMEGADHVVR